MPDPSTAESNAAPAAPTEDIGRAAAGDRAAFDRLHERFAPGLLRFVSQRVGGNTELAEEVAQSTWIAAWDMLQRGRFDPARGAFSTFLYAIGSKYWLRQQRDARTEARIMGAIAPPPAGGDAADADPGRLLAGVELLEDAQRCLFQPDGGQALSDEERDIVIGIARGETERDLARRLGLAPSTINARKQAAYNKLRQALLERGWSAESVEQGVLNLE